MTIAASRTKLKEINALVKKHFPRINVVEDAWTNLHRGWRWDFHGPDKFYWCGLADNAYDCRCKGWLAYLKHRGIIIKG